MTALSQKEKATQFRLLHQRSPLLVLPNVWDAASAATLATVGFPAIATTSSGVAASFGYSDGQRISRNMLVETVERITHVVECPVSVDIEAGYGDTVEEVLQTIKAVIAAGAVGINIEDSTKQQAKSLVEISFQVELLKAIQEQAALMDVPLVVNARTDVFLLKVGDPSSRLELAIQRANAYREAGADCLFPIGVGDARTIEKLVQAINGPINILASDATPTLEELAQLGVARVSFGSGLMRAVLGHLRQIAQELLTYGTYTNMTENALSGPAFQSLFVDKNS